MTHRTASLLLGMGLLLAPALAAAQGGELDLGATGHDTGAPIEITAERLSVDQAAGVTVFTGDVLIVQGEMRLSAETVEVEYRGGTEAAGRGRIRRMLASGGVTAVTDTEAAEAREAVYDVDGGRIEMRGDVMLTQGESAVSGDTLVIDLTDGTGTMEGRVRTVLQPDAAE